MLIHYAAMQAKERAWNAAQRVGSLVRSLVPLLLFGLYAVRSYAPLLLFGLVALGLFAPDAYGQAPAWPEDVPELLPVADVQAAATGILAYLLPVFMLVSFALMAAFVIWRVFKGFVGARA